MGTTFNQNILGCDSWYSSNCSLAPLSYDVNVGPIVEEAGKSISMLLKSREQSRDPIESSSILEKISSLYGGNVEQSKLSHSDSGVGEEHISNSVNDSELEDSANVSKALNVDHSEEIGSKDGDESEESLNLLESANADMSDSKGFYSQYMNEGFVFDPVTRQYYMKDYDLSETDWEDGALNEYRSFYGDYDDTLMHSENKPANLDNYVDDRANEENLQEDENYGNFYVDEFSKRIMQLRSSRRKPVYVVLDDPNINSESDERMNYFLAEPTENSNLAETISIDDLISESSTGVPQRMEEEDLGLFDQLQRIYDEETEDVNAENPETDESRMFEELEAQQSSEMGPDVLDFPQESDSEQENDLELTYSTDEPEEVMDENYQSDSSLYSENDAEEESLDFDLSVDQDSDVQILSDESEEAVPESKTDEILYIPDSLDYEAEDTEYRSIDPSQSEDFEYVYSNTFETPAGDPYVNVRTANDFESEGTRDYDSYPAYEDRRYVQLSPGSMNSQYLPPGYQYIGTEEQFLPQGYQYMLDEQNESTYPYEIPVSYRNKAALGPEYARLDVTAAGDPNVYYDVTQMEGSNGAAYDYNYMQPDAQQTDMGYPYSEQFDYYDNRGIQYAYENYLGDEGQDAYEDLEESAEAENFDSLNDQYESEEGNENVESSSVGSFDETSSDAENEDSQVDYVEGDEAATYSDVNTDEQNEEVYYLLDTDEDAEKQETDELSEESINLDYGQFLDSNYAEKNALDAEFGENLHDSLKSTKSENEETDAEHVESQASKPTNESKSSPSSHESFVASKDALDSYKTDGIAITGSEAFHRNAEHIPETWPYQDFANQEIRNPTTFPPMQGHLADFDAQKGQPVGEFLGPNGMFMNNMAFQTPMGFSSYGYSNPNIPQFNMAESSNMDAFSKKNGDFANAKENADQVRLSKLSSLKDKVLSMKRGKFGMFKKSLKTL